MVWFVLFVLENVLAMLAYATSDEWYLHVAFSSVVTVRVFVEDPPNDPIGQ